MTVGKRGVMIGKSEMINRRRSNGVANNTKTKGNERACEMDNNHNRNLDPGMLGGHGNADKPPRVRR